MRVRVNGGYWWFWCPGCESLHSVTDLWVVTGEGDTFTVSPSIKTWWTDDQGDHVCHSFVQNATWKFLDDSTHALAGQEVPMVEIPVGTFSE